MRLLWVARAPAPYRYPVWEAVGRRVSLQVAFMNPDDKVRDWRAQGSDLFAQSALPCFAAPYGEDYLYVLKPGWRKRLPKFDAVVFQGAWETPAFWQILRTAKRQRWRCVLFYESTGQSMRYRAGIVARARRRFMMSMDRVVTPGVAATEAVRAQGIPEERVVTSVNVVDGKWFRAVADRHRAVPDVGHVYLVVARLVALKRIDIAVEAFAAIGRPEDSLIIVGSGPEEGALRELCSELGIANRVVFTGYLPQSEVAKVYGRAQTLVLASSREVWGLVVNEALSAGLHTIVSDRCGVARSVNGMPGVWVVRPDVASLSQAMVNSRNSWHGCIPDPPILGYSAERLAADICGAVEARAGGLG